MAVSSTGAFGQAGRFFAAVCTAAKTTYNDITNAVSMGAAGAQGSLITRVGAFPRATVASTQIELFIQDGSSNVYFVGSALMAAYTMATNTAPTATAINDVYGTPYTEANPLYLPTGYTLYGGIAVALAGGIVIQASGIDL